jgi:hypothetical protein
VEFDLGGAMTTVLFASPREGARHFKPNRAMEAPFVFRSASGTTFFLSEIQSGTGFGLLPAPRELLD